MKLNAGERLTLMSILPELGNFETMSTVSKLRTTLEFTEEEVALYEVKQNGENVSFNAKGWDEVEKELSVKGQAMLLSTLERFDKEGKLTIHLFNIFTRFKAEVKD